MRFYQRIPQKYLQLNMPRTIFRQRGRVGWSAVGDGSNRTFKPHDGCVVVSMEKVHRGNFPAWLHFLLQNAQCQQNW